MQLLGRDSELHFLEVPANVPGLDVEELEPVMLAPDKELSNGVKVVFARMGIGEFAAEELVPSETRGPACVADDSRRRAGLDRKRRRDDRRELGGGATPLSIF